MKSIKKIVAAAFTTIFAVGAFAGCSQGDKTDNGDIPQLPDYTAVAKDFDFFAYSGPMNGEFTVDGVKKQLGTDQRTVEGYTTFKDAGFNVAMLTGTAGYVGSDWENSECKRAWDAAIGAGIDRIILTDNRLDGLVQLKDNLVGEGCRFETEDDLCAFVKECISTYKDYEGFYGLRIFDEPDYSYMNAMGYIYKATKKAAKELGIEDIYIHLNLLPLGNNSHEKYDPDATSLEEAYRNYVNGYLDATGANRVSSDVYLNRGTGLCNWFYQTVQILRECAEAHGADVTFCLQSFEQYNGTNKIYSAVGKSEMLHEMYSLIGMGIDDFAYYTYQPPESYNTKLPSPEGTNFLTAAGEKTNVYYAGQDAMAIAQSMSDVILNYEYQGAKFYLSSMPNFDVSCYTTSYMDTATNTSVSFKNDHEFTLLKNVSHDNDAVFTTELYDETNALYMYMLQNPIAPSNGEYGRTAENIQATFDASYTYVAEFHNGYLEYVKLENGVYAKTLSAGDAVYLVPLK